MSVRTEWILESILAELRALNAKFPNPSICKACENLAKESPCGHFKLPTKLTPEQVAALERGDY